MYRKLFNQATLLAWQEIDPENWRVLVADIINTFFEVGLSQFNSLNESWISHDYDGVQRFAHSLKSSCGNVGAERVQDLMQAIEKNAETGNLNALRNLMEELPLLFTESSLQLSDFLRNKVAEP